MAGRRKRTKSKPSSSAPSPPPPPWVELPRDVTANILQRLGTEEILESAQKVCPTWRSVCKDPSMWRRIHLSHDSSRRFDYDIMCRHAVVRSQGHLQDISLCEFGSDLLLKYIAGRSRGLRSLTLDFCEDITGNGLVEAAKRLPLLEELSLTLVAIDAKYIERVGRSCPVLKSFKLRKPIFRHWLKKFDTEAPAIAKAMPQLRHLHLEGNRMRNQDLVAVLDGCTHLDSLHLELCINVWIDGDLAKRLARQIKHFKYLKDSNATFGSVGDSEYLSYLRLCHRESA